jgi:hypothetical protein
MMMSESSKLGSKSDFVMPIAWGLMLLLCTCTYRKVGSTAHFPTTQAEERRRRALRLSSLSERERDLSAAARPQCRPPTDFAFRSSLSLCRPPSILLSLRERET